MKSKMQLIVMSIGAYLLLSFGSCKSLQHTVYYEESRFPNHLDIVQLNFLNDSIVEIKSSNDSRTFKYYRLGKYYYKITESNVPPPNPNPFSYLTNDTLIVKRGKIYYFSDEVKLIFNSRQK